MKLICGVDIGGTSVKSILIDEAQSVLSNASFPTDSESGPEIFLENLCKSIQDQLETIPDGRLIAVGIGCTGPVNIETGVILNPYTLPGLDGFALVKALEERIGVPVAFENDANTAHLGELAGLTGEIPENTLLMTIGTGVGCSLRVGGELYNIPGGIHPEIGHIATGIDSEFVCYCGKTNCMENSLSGTAINRDAKHLFGLTPEEILDHCDTPAKQAYRENLIKALTQSITSLVGVFNCEMVFLVGGMRSFFEKYLIEDCQKRFNQLEPIYGKTRFAKTEPNYLSGCLGAANLARNQMRKRNE